jgi:hypothetical protein
MRPRGSSLFVLRSRDITRHFFAVSVPKKQLKGTRALSYIEYGERCKLNSRDTFAAKSLWYAQQARPPADLIIPCGVGNRYYCSLNHARAVTSNSFTEIRVNNRSHVVPIWAFLNSPLGWLMMELSGRTTLGGGMLKVDPTDIRKMMVPDPRLFTKPVLGRVRRLLQREVGTVFQESKAEDRAVLDEYVLTEVLGLSSKDRDDLIETVAKLVRDRYARAQSAPKKHKGAAGIDLVGLVENAIHDLGSPSLSDFIRDIIGKKTSRNVELPKFAGEPRAEATLLGWRLSDGRRSVDCGSEAEANYLRAFAVMGWDSAPVPSGMPTHARVYGEWDALFKGTQAQLAKAADSIVMPKTRQRFIRMFWTRMRELARSTATERKTTSGGSGGLSTAGRSGL